MLQRLRKSQVSTTAGGFTLTELLVVVGVIALLIAILMPALNGARRQARTVVCANNVRQLCLAMINYATADKGNFPPYNLTANRFWYQPDKLGKFLPSIVWNEVRGPAVTCPEDPDANRSYSMNIWVSGDALLSPKLAAAGRLWRPRDKNSSKMILVAEKWSTIFNPVSKPLWATDGTIGFNLYTPGQRFGGGTGENFPTNRFGTASSELPYQRHRKPSGPGVGLQSIGAVNIGYVDGHVALKYNGDLYDMNTGKSTLDSLWSPADYDLNN